MLAWNCNSQPDFHELWINTWQLVDGKSAWPLQLASSIVQVHPSPLSLQNCSKGVICISWWYLSRVQKLAAGGCQQHRMWLCQKYTPPKIDSNGSSFSHCHRHQECGHENPMGPMDHHMFPQFSHGFPCFSHAFPMSSHGFSHGSSGLPGQGTTARSAAMVRSSDLERAR